jgi:hypothetical protein
MSLANCFGWGHCRRQFFRIQALFLGRYQATLSCHSMVMGQFEFSLFVAQGRMPALAGMTTVDSTRSSAGIVIPAQAGILQAFLGAHSSPAAGNCILGG